MNLLRKNIQNMQGYVPGEQPQDNSYIKLNTNENFYKPTPLINADNLAVILDKGLNLYPEPSCYALRELIGKNYGFDKANIIIGNGSDELLSMIVKTFVEEGDIVGFPYPSYLLYEILAEIEGIKIQSFPFNKDYSLDFEKIKKSKVKIFFIPNPNSPSGTFIPVDIIEKFVSDFKGLCVIDEAYVDFAEDTCLELAKKYNNVIILRTVSKSFSLAGIRLGYAFACKDIIEGLFKVKDSYNINRFTQEIGLFAFSDMDYMKKNVEQIKKIRDWVVIELNKLGFFVYPSQANFIFGYNDKIDGKKLYEKLKERKILVRYFDIPELKNGIRITVGKQEDMEKFLDECRSVIVS